MDYLLPCNNAHKTLQLSVLRKKGKRDEMNKDMTKKKKETKEIKKEKDGEKST